MADRERLYEALRNADAAGDVEAARKLAGYIRQMDAAPAKSRKALDPSEYDPSSPEYQAKYGATSGMTWGDKFSAGVGKSLVDTGRGIAQLGAMAADAVLPRAPSMSQLVTGEDPSYSAAVQRNIDEAAARDAPLMETGGGVTGNILGQVAQFAVPAGYIARGGKLAARVGRSALFGGAVANTQPVATGQSRALNTALGAGGGAAGEGLAAGVGKLAQGAASKVSAETKKLAERARELGIPLRAEQVTGSRPLAGVSAALDTIPFSGRDASRNVQRAAWNRALSRTVGQSDTNLTTAVKNAEEALGAKYDSVLRSNSVKVDDAFQSQLDEALQSARSELPEAQFSVIAKQVDEILSKVGSEGAIEGQAAYNIKRVLDRIGRSKEPYAYHARQLKDALIGALDRSLPPEVAKAFTKTRGQYANLIALRGALRAGAEGTVTPAKLATLKVRGDLKELADIGATFLVEPFGNSGTANRTIGAGILGALGGGAAFDPTLAATAAISGGTVGRTANALLQAQPVVNYALNGSNTLRLATPYTNALLPTLGAVAGQ